MGQATALIAILAGLEEHQFLGHIFAGHLSCFRQLLNLLLIRSLLALHRCKLEECIWERLLAQLVALRVLLAECVLIVVGCFGLFGLARVHEILYLREHLLVLYENFLLKKALHMPWQSASFAVHLRSRAMLPDVQVCNARVTVAVIVNLLGLLSIMMIIVGILMMIDELDIDHHIWCLFGKGILCVPMPCFFRREYVVDFLVLILAVIVVNSVFILI